MGIKHRSGLREAFCCLLAAAMLTACSGGGSSSAAPAGPAAPGGPTAGAPDPGTGALDALPPVFTAELRSAAEQNLQQARAAIENVRTSGNLALTALERERARTNTEFDADVAEARTAAFRWAALAVANLHRERLTLAGTSDFTQPEIDQLLDRLQQGPADLFPDDSPTQINQMLARLGLIAQIRVTANNQLYYAQCLAVGGLDDACHRQFQSEIRRRECAATGIPTDSCLQGWSPPSAREVRIAQQAAERRCREAGSVCTPDASYASRFATAQVRAWFDRMSALTQARELAKAWYAAARVEFTALLARRGELEQDVIDATAVANVIADSRNGRAPATPQTGQRFALVHAAPRKTGAVLAFRTEAGVSSEGPDALFFKPHGTLAEQRQYRVSTSGQANPGLSIAAREAVLSRAAEPRSLLPANIPLRSDAGVLSDAAGDSRRFPGRGTVFRGGLRGSAARVIQDGDNLAAGSAAAVQRRLQIQGDASDREADGTADDAHAWKDWHAAPFTTFRYDAINGWAMGFGGSGVVFADLARYASKPEAGTSSLAANQDNDDVTNNIEITFGARPAGYAGLDPHLPAYYWNLKAPSLRRGADGALVDGPGQTSADRFDGGRYELLLSTYMGSRVEISPPPEGRAYQIIRNADGSQSLEITELNTGLSEAEIAAERAAGQAQARLYAEERQKLEPENYLLHAAYGLFAFSSRFDGAERLSRLQTFHFGRQTFADTPGQRITDLNGAVAGKNFFGHTMGWLLTGADSGDKSADSRISGRHRIRGKVQLQLDIYQADPNMVGGFILGAIDNLQVETGPGRWSSDASGALGAGTAAALRGTIQLNVMEDQYFHPTVAVDSLSPPDEDDWENLRNDGTYSGGAVPLNPTDPNTFEETASGIGDFFAAGEFEGALYGPKSEIPETAGTWWVPARLDFTGAEGMIGSFGAFCAERLQCAP